MARDYYEILGVAKGADEAALKTAYRKKAMQYHPDRNPGDKTAEAKFKEINEAYDVLKDSQKRAAYDRFGHEAFTKGGGNAAGGRGGGGFGQGQGFGQGFGGGGFQFDGNVEDLFEDLMGGLFGGGGQQTRRSRVQRGADLRYNLEVTLEQAFAGTKAKIQFPTSVVCETCDGSGAKKGSKPTTCATCRGAGQVSFRQGFFQMSRTCPECGGAGQTIADKCRDCGGHGRKRQTKVLDVNIPAGVDEGTRLRLAGEGEAGAHGGDAGDLFVFVQVKPHAIFKRDNLTLALDVPVSMLDAALGAEVELPTIDGGKTMLKVPAGSQPGETIRLPGFGMPALGRPRDRGDLQVRLQVEIPTHLDKSQRQALEALRSSLGATRGVEGFRSRLRKFWG